MRLFIIHPKHNTEAFFTFCANQNANITIGNWTHDLISSSRWTTAAGMLWIERRLFNTMNPVTQLQGCPVAQATAARTLSQLVTFVAAIFVCVRNVPEQSPVAAISDSGTNILGTAQLRQKLFHLVSQAASQALSCYSNTATEITTAPAFSFLI